MNDDIIGHIGYVVRQAREEFGLSQSEVAEFISITRPRLSEIENGRAREIGITKIEELLNELGLQLVVEEIAQ